MFNKYKPWKSLVFIFQFSQVVIEKIKINQVVWQFANITKKYFLHGNSTQNTRNHMGNPGQVEESAT